MKKRYKRDAYYLDDGILIHGYKDKRGFHPDPNIECGFGLQIIRKKDINKTIFYKFSNAIKTIGELEVCGGRVIVAIDAGMAITKIGYNIGDFSGWYNSENILPKIAFDKDIEKIVLECFNAQKIQLLHGTKVIYVVNDFSDIHELTID